MSIISPHTHHYQNSVPSMEHDDSYSDTDTVLYTPTSSTTTMYYHPSWNSSPAFEDTVSPLSNRPFSSPPLATKNRCKKAIDAIDTQLSCVRRISSPPDHPTDDTFHKSGPLSPISPSAEHYETAIRRMSQHIDDFFNSRQLDTKNCDIPLKKSPTDSGPSSVATGTMINMVHQFRDTLICDTTIDPDHEEKQILCDAMLAWLQDQPSSGNHQQQLDNERQKNARLITSITRLAQRHHNAKHAYKQELSKSRRQESTASKNKWNERLHKEKKARQEAEEILDSVRVEMETMMDELDTAKQQLFTAQKEAQHVRHQWEDIIQKNQPTDKVDSNGNEEVDPWVLLSLQQEDWEHRMNSISEENRRLKSIQLRSQEQLENQIIESQTLKQRVLQAERQAAEYDLKLVVLQSQQTKNVSSSTEEKDELIMALQRELVEKSSALARWDKQWQQQTKQWDQQQAAQRQSRLTDQQAWQEEYARECQKQQDLALLRITRDTRALEAQLDDLSMENERLEACVAEFQQKWHRMDQRYHARETTWARRQLEWERTEKEAKALVLALEQKVIGLEAEAIRLYGKNITLANQLGACD